ncbi:MAG TPA: hypothetical protein VL422_00570 [Miltoncostaea sp.]|nr:hypothetical protein [Miltoncostaea sp.]
MADRWRCLTTDPATGIRYRATHILDALALTMDDVLAGDAVPEEWLLRGRMPPAPAECRGWVAATAAAVRQALASGVSGDRETALLLWLVKYADTSAPEPMRTIHPDRTERRHASRALRGVLPDLGGEPGDPAAEALLQLLRATRPRAIPGVGAAPG